MRAAASRGTKGIAMRIKNWILENDRISGYLFGSSRYPDGTYVKTSMIIAAAYDGEMLLLHTRNSVYECHVGDYKGDAGVLNEFIRTMAEDAGGTTKVIPNL